MLRTLMTGPVWLSYGQIMVESTGEFAELGECFGGQRNGLCGATIEGHLRLMTGLHTGTVDFTAELHDGEPPLDDTWEETVETSYRPLARPTLSGLDARDCWTLDLDLVHYRVRYCGWGMDAAHRNGQQDGEPPVDRYLLQFWPAPPAPDRVVKVTSKQAAYWHEFAREQPFPAEIAARKLENARQDEARRLAERAAAWGGALPGERLERTMNGQELASFDRALVDELEQTDSQTLRWIARWAARRACEEAGYADDERIAGILDRMDRGADWLETLNGPPRQVEPGGPASATVHQFITQAYGWFADRDPIDNTITVVSATFNVDSFSAAVETVWLASEPFPDKTRLLTELHERFLSNPTV
ncbi:hypothetical protein [Kribbella sp. NPDC000426]|uniref:hypothetical protein n=1 Tax=Kribbella sp. NPDC000426 TaxID=3154255 RepID=UPI00332C07C5